MKRLPIFIAIILAIILGAITYRQWHGMVAPISSYIIPSVKQETSNPKQDKPEDLSTYSTESTIFASSTLGIRFELPSSDGTFIWKELETTKVPSSTVKLVKLIERHTPQGELACVATIAVVAGPLNSLKEEGYSTESITYGVAGNEQVHIVSTQKDLCNVRLTLDVGPNIRAIYKSRGLKEGEVPQSNYGTCTDYRLETPITDLVGESSYSSFMDSAVNSLLMGSPLKAEDGSCSPFSVRFARIASSDRYIVYLNTLIYEPGQNYYYPQEQAYSMIKLTNLSATNEFFSEPGVIGHFVSPDQRYLLKQWDILVTGIPRQELTLTDLLTGSSVLPSRVILGIGRQLGFSETYAGNDLEAHWTGPRTITISTISSLSTSADEEDPKAFEISY